MDPQDKAQSKPLYMTCVLDTHNFCQTNLFKDMNEPI